ncbi:MAG: nucleotide exchange factor GrpE [Clostridia bacterium]|nr:nucleotide exchange factor GrpE [Clostridia bacterium]
MAAAKGKGNKDKTEEIPIEETVEEVEEKNEAELKLEKLESELAEMTDSYRRLAAEFDNYRKRTIREKDEIYKNATASLIEAFLPIMDSMEAAKASVDENAEKAALKQGIELVYRKFREVLDKLDVEEIEALGEEFDPELHNAVMHVTDEGYGENEVAEVLQKGYVFKDKVIRHSIVKVAN